MAKVRLDQLVFRQGLVASRSQAESYIKLGQIIVNGKSITKPGYFVDETAEVKINIKNQYVSRAGLKLASAQQKLNLNFKDQVILDVGSSTGGFTDFALRSGANKVIAVDVGTDQLHPSLRKLEKITLMEKTDIRDVEVLSEKPDIIVIDVSFISLRDILPSLIRHCKADTMIVAMFKPQFESGSGAKHKGVIKNDAVRRSLLKDFEIWAREYFVVLDKADSEVEGAKGNKERFYLLKPNKKLIH